MKFTSSVKVIIYEVIQSG